MKVKKELQKANEEINAQILQEGSDVYDKLIAENEFIDDSAFKDKKNNIFFNRKKFVLICSLCSFVILVLSLSIILPIVLKNNQPIEYLEDNEKIIEVAVDVINSEFSALRINDTEMNCLSSRVYDGKYGDTLYYKITLAGNGEIEGKLNVVVNKNYVFKERYVGEKIEETYKGYKLTYSVNLDDSDMLPMNNFFGCVEIEDIKIYFEFVGFSEIFTTPLPFLDQVLIIE